MMFDRWNDGCRHGVCSGQVECCRGPVVIDGRKIFSAQHGLHYAQHDIVVARSMQIRVWMKTRCWNCCSRWQDPSVAAVSATVLAWNPFSSLRSMAAGIRYRQTIFISRMARGRMNMLGIVSRGLRSVPDLSASPARWLGCRSRRRRRSGAPHSQGRATTLESLPTPTVFTNVPTSWVRLFWQRCRWDRTVITFECANTRTLGTRG